MAPKLSEGLQENYMNKQPLHGLKIHSPLVRSHLAKTNCRASPKLITEVGFFPVRTAKHATNVREETKGFGDKFPSRGLN